MASVSSMTVYKKPWDFLPVEIRIMILKTLLKDGCSVASSAAVSREWQRIIEQHNFARIKLTASLLADFGSVVHRNRALVGYIWLCLELEEYDCTLCAPTDPSLWGLNDTDNTLITTAFQNLFSTLSAWEPNGDLLLDVSVYSPSDSEHWFKYLTFVPDSPPDECDQNPCVEQAMRVKLNDHKHGWIDGNQESTPIQHSVYKVFDEIMGEGPFVSEEQEKEWWQQLPLIPAVTGVLIRQQTRHRWKPPALVQMFSRFPRLQEIHYEPWREWSSAQQGWTDKLYQLLFKSLTSNKLRRLVVFENFNQQYPSNIGFTNCEPTRIPSSAVSRMVANASLKLEHLSATFLVDASYFFHARQRSWKWLNLTSLVLTSRLLAPDESLTEISDMLQEAAAAAIEMPKLETMEIWNGREGLATLFRYHLIRDEKR